MQGVWRFVGLGALVVLTVVSALAMPEALLALTMLALLVILYFVTPRRVAVGVGVVIANTVVAVLPAGTLSGVPFGNLVAGVAATLIVLAGFLRSGRRIHRPRFVGLLVGYVAILLLGAFSNTPDMFYVVCTVYGIVIFWAASNATQREAGIIRAGIVWLATIEGALALLEALSGTGPLLGRAIQIDADNPFLDGLTRAQGTLGHPLVLGLLLLVGLGLVLFSDELSSRSRLILVPVLAVSILLTGSTSVVLTSAALIVYWFLARRSWVGASLAALVTTLAAVLVINAGGVNLLLGDEISGRAVSHRLNSIAALPNLLFDRDVIHSIFGNGLGSVGKLYDDGTLINDGFTAVDNQFVTVLAQTGIIGVALLSTFVVCFLIRGKRRYLPVAVAMVIMAFSFDILSWFLTSGLFLALAGIALGTTWSHQITHVSIPALPANVFSASAQTTKGSVARLGDRL